MFKENGFTFDPTSSRESPAMNDLNQSFSFDQTPSLPMGQLGPYDPTSYGQENPSAPTVFMELFGAYRSAVASAPRNVEGGVIGSLFNGDERNEREGSGFGNGVSFDHQDMDQYGNFQYEGNNSGVMLDFTMENFGGSFGRGCGGIMHKINRANPLATEQQRRMQMSGKFTALRVLIPNPTKADRASVVGDAIDYIKELTRSVQELKLLVERKRCGRDKDEDITRIKKHKADHDQIDGPDHCGGGDNNEIAPDDQAYNPSMALRSSWLQRKSKDTEVDVRIVEDEVTVKLVQRRKINLLLAAASVLDQLRLDIRYISGGCIGDSYSFLFNTKIKEGSSIYASAIANKLIEVLDLRYASSL